MDVGTISNILLVIAIVFIAIGLTRAEQLSKQIKEQGLSLDSFKTYIDFFRYGCPPHGGFAPGPTRMLMKIFNIINVREVTYLYRGVKRLNP